MYPELVRVNWYRGLCAHCGGLVFESTHVLETTHRCWYCESENIFYYSEKAQSHEPPPDQICDPSNCMNMRSRDQQLEKFA